MKTPGFHPKWLFWTVVALCILGIAVAFSETCLYLEIMREDVSVLKSMGCD